MLQRDSAGGGEGDSHLPCLGLRSAVGSSWPSCDFTEAQREFGFLGVVAGVLECLQAADAMQEQPLWKRLRAMACLMEEKPHSNTGHRNWVTVSFTL